MNFLKYQKAQEFLDDVGCTVEQGLQLVETELKRLKEG